MHSGFAYFCDESSGSWKILRKFEATAPSKCDVIYPKKIQEQLWKYRAEILHEQLKLCFCTEIGALPKLSSVHQIPHSKSKKYTKLIAY